MSPTKQFSSFVDIVRYHADHQPDNTAYIFLKEGEKDEMRITYAELDLKAKTIAARLQQQCRFGDRVLLLYPPGLEFISAFFACLYAGVLAVPVYPPNPANIDVSMEKLMTIFSDAKPSAALTIQEIASMVDYIKGDFPELGEIDWIASDKTNSDISNNFAPPIINKDTTAFLQYTSGSTGNPKGVMVSHGNILYNQEMIKAGFGHTKHTVFVGWLPLFHDMGLIGNILQPLYLGIICILMSPVDFLKKPFQWLDAISRYKATTSGGPNFGYDLCVRKITDEQIRTLDLSSWSVAFNGAEPVRAETIRSFSEKFKVCGFDEKSFYPCYGMAEATLFISGGRPTIKPKVCNIESASIEKGRVNIKIGSDKSTQQIVGCGQTWLDQKIYIVDPKSLTQSPKDTIGEIWVYGNNVTQGYWNKSKETEDTFNAYIKDTGEGPFFRTGDLGFMVDKELFITGRRKDLIIIRGRNFYPHDLEDKVWKTHPSLRQGCSVAVAIEVENDEKLLIVQEVKEQYLEKVDFHVIIDNIFKTIVKYNDITPHAVVLVKQGTIPKTSSGKVQRNQCRKKFLYGTLDTISMKIQDSSEPQAIKRNNKKEFKTIEDIKDWMALRISKCTSFDSEIIEFSSPLFDYGLDSKELVSINGDIEEIFGIEISPVKLMDNPTIFELASYLAEAYFNKKAENS